MIMMMTMMTMWMIQFCLLAFGIFELMSGSHVTTQRPQNDPGAKGHVTYRGTAPIFATTKLDDMEKLEWLSAVNPSTGTAYDVNASMVFRRLKVYKFTAKLVKPKEQRIYCQCCFATLVLGQVGM